MHAAPPPTPVWAAPGDRAAGRVPRGGRRRTARLLLPARTGPGPFPAVLWNHGSERLPGWQPDLAAFYTANGFAFFIPHRRGQGQSGAAGPYIVDRQPSKLAVVADRRFGRPEDRRPSRGSQPRRRGGARLAEGASRHRPRPHRHVGRLVRRHPDAAGGREGPRRARLRRLRPGRDELAMGDGARRAIGGGRRAHASARADRAGPERLQPRAEPDAWGRCSKRPAKGRAVVFPAFGTSEQEGHGGFACRADG